MPDVPSRWENKLIRIRDVQVSEVIVQVAWVWEHRSTSMAPPPCMDNDKNR